ncbi:MAG: DNA mismatch endonuclease Vsr [Dehalococcoidia bacterium]
MTETRSYYGDNLTKEQRSRTMRAVKSRDTAPERALRKALRQIGLTGYRIDVGEVPGRPDVTFGRRQLAVFVDGGYWHGRPDRVRPGRSEYWDTKIQRTIERDRRTDRALKERGWKVLRLWDDEVLRDPNAAARRVARRLLARPTAEFFAGIGLVGKGLAEAGFEVVFANDIDGVKRSLFAANGDVTKFVWGDIRLIHGADVPHVELATASFPCTDLSLAGNRNGLNGQYSSTFWEFVRILREMEGRRPKALLIENVSGFVSSAQGQDLALALAALNDLGYYCDLLQLDARNWVPQSRTRMFIIASDSPLSNPQPWIPRDLRPAPICEFALQHSSLQLQAAQLPELPHFAAHLSDAVERIHPSDQRWWSASRVRLFVSSLSEIQRTRLKMLKKAPDVNWRTAYRRTRRGSAVWEIRADEIAGCLRTSKGGSSKQALVEAGLGKLKVRWMTPREYANLMGVPHFDLSTVTENQALYGLGDAVCVPAVEWLAHNYLGPLLDGELTSQGNRNGASSH